MTQASKLIPIKENQTRKTKSDLFEQKITSNTNNGPIDYSAKNKIIERSIKQKRENLAGIVLVQNYDTVQDSNRAAIASLEFQRTGKYNQGVIGQYPYFAPDLPHLKAAKQASEADKLLLKLWTQTKANVHVLEEGNPTQNETNSKDEKQKLIFQEHGDHNDVVNFLKSQSVKVSPKTKKKVLLSNSLKANRKINGESLTQNIFDQSSQTAKNNLVGLSNQILTDTDGLSSGQQRRKLKSTGRIVPFFPKDWNKNANSVFNQEGLILEYQQGEKFEAIQEVDDYENQDFTEKKIISLSQNKISQNEQNYQYQAEINPAIGGARPTSGKHYSRHFDSQTLSKYLHQATQPPFSQYLHLQQDSNLNQESPEDDLKSQIAKHFEATCKVEELLSKLNSYMNGEGPQSTKAETNSQEEFNSVNQKITETDHKSETNQEDQQQKITDSIVVQSNTVHNTLYKVADQLKQNFLDPQGQKYSQESSKQVDLISQTQVVPNHYFINEDSEEEDECFSHVHHRFHSHTKVRSRQEQIYKLNYNNRSRRILSFPDMEFALTPVPGPVAKPGNIYQRTKLLIDPDYVLKLQQFEQRLKNGKIHRKGRKIEGIFEEQDHFQQSSMENYNKTGQQKSISQLIMNQFGQNLENLDQEQKIEEIKLDNINKESYMLENQFVDSNHIPYDPYYTEKIQKLQERQYEQQRKLKQIEQQKTFIFQQLQELKQGCKIQEINENQIFNQQNQSKELQNFVGKNTEVAQIFKGHLKSMSPRKAQKKVRIVRNHSQLQNHQAFWVHGAMKEEDRQKLQIDRSRRSEHFFAQPNTKMEHVRSYMMVGRKFIPSLNYIVQQPIFNRFKVEDEKQNVSSKSQSLQELITFPQIDGPLKLHNIGFDNELNYLSQKLLERSNHTMKANVVLSDPKGKRNLQSYIKELQAKQQITDEITKSQLIKMESSNNESLFNDPREFEDLIAENKDLQHQFICQLQNLESYAKVANIWSDMNQDLQLNQTFRNSVYGENGSSDGSNSPIRKLLQQRNETARKSYKTNKLSAQETNDQTQIDLANISNYISTQDRKSHQSRSRRNSVRQSSQISSGQKKKIPKTTIIDKISQFNKKIKSFFFGIKDSSDLEAQTVTYDVQIAQDEIKNCVKSTKHWNIEVPLDYQMHLQKPFSTKTEYLLKIQNHYK